MIGLERHTVKLACHSDTWIAYGTAQCERLRDACCGVACKIQHVGSTSVPGLAAKLVIDMVIGLEDMADLNAVQTALPDMGYVYLGLKGQSSGHLFVLDSAPDVRVEHLHVIPLRSSHWDCYIVFRDALIGDEELARHYSRLKETLCTRYPNDREQYTAGKAKFIRSVIEAIRYNKRCDAASPSS